MARGRGSGRFAALDGLRAIAVLSVFLHHLDDRLFIGGWVGVDLFFALSGYLITALLIGEWANTDRVRLSAFYARRLLRLMPALLVLLVVVVPVAMWRDVGRPVPDGVAAVLYLMDFYAPLSDSYGGLLAHTWSLAVEEQFYVFWPVLLVLGLPRRWPLVRLVAGLIVLATVVGAAAALLGGPSGAYRTPFPHLPVMLLGVLLAIAASRWPNRVRPLGAPWIAAAAGVVVIAVTLLLNQRSTFLYVGGFIALGAVLTALVAALVVAPTGPAARTLSVQPLVWLGQRSYGFYLWHLPLLIVLDQFIANTAMVGVAGLALTLACTVASWQLVEQPFLRLKRRFESDAQVSVTAEASRGSGGHSDLTIATQPS